MTTAFLTFYLLAMLVTGTVSLRRVRGAASFFVADRGSGPAVVAGSLIATILGASATIGVAGNAYRDGLVAAWWLLVGVAGLLLLSFAFAEKFRRLGLYTLPEVLEAQYGRGVKLAASLIIAVAWLGVIAAQIVAAGRILAHAAAGDGTVWTIVAALVFIAYTVLGGQLSILRTDLGQAILLLVGLALCAALGWARVGGWTGLVAALPAESLRFPVNQAMGPSKVLGWLLVVGLTYTVGPDMISRLFCARDERAARSAALGAAAVLLPIAFLVATIGLLARALAPGIEAEQALPEMITLCLPAWAAGLVHAGLLAAMMSSADTCLLTTGTILAVDVVGIDDERALAVARWLVVAVGLLSLAVALRLGGVIGTLLWAYTIYTCGLAVPVLLGFRRRELRLSAAGAVGAMIGGGGLGLAGKLTGHDWSLAALALSVVLLVAVSRAAPSRTAAEDDTDAMLGETDA